MTALIISPDAQGDLQDIGDYIAQDNIDAAIAFVERLQRRCAEVASFPRMGRKRDEFLPGLRSVLEGDYLIFYRTSAGTTEIVRIIHGYRNLEQALSPE